MEKVFVYGSLRQGFWNHQRLLMGRAEMISTATVQGDLYQLPEGYPALIKGAAIVRGEVFILPEKEMLRELDRLEGYRETGSANLYDRVERMVQLDDGQEITCWIYLYCDRSYARSAGKQVRSGDWRLYMESGGEEMINYFAYGSCTNLESFQETMKENEFSVLGVGRLDGYKLAFTRFSKKHGGVLDFIPSEGDHVLGVIYQIPEQAIRNLDNREGYPNSYDRTSRIVKLETGEEIEVITYEVVSKVMDEFLPNDEYYNRVLKGMNPHFPGAYINKYFIGHVNQKFGKEFTFQPEDEHGNTPDQIRATMKIQTLRYLRSKPIRQGVFEITNTVGAARTEDAQWLINELNAQGYIRQDSRDTFGPYSDSATYYTVPRKRAEIDRMLEEDRISSYASLGELNCVEADEDDKTPVCMHCRQIFRKGRSTCPDCLQGTQLIDTRILDILFKLNEKGYQTVFSCGGHANLYDSYIVFKQPLDCQLQPKGFSMDRFHGVQNISIHSLPYHIFKGITMKKMLQTVDETTLKVFNRANLDCLRQWAEDLPARNQG